MKIKKIIPALLVTLGLVACAPVTPSSESSSSEEVSSEINSSETPSSEEVSSEIPPVSSEQEGDWTEDEKALIDQYAYGYDIPYHYIEGNSALYYDSEYDCLSLTGAQTNFATLTAYADKFTDAGWTLTTNVDEDNVYQFETVVELPDATRYLSATLYLLDTDGYYTIEEGTFWLDLYDPYIYAWPTEIVSQIVNVLTETDINVPAYECDRYSLDASYIMFGLAWIDCYTDDVNAAEVYCESLQQASYSIVAGDEEFDGYYAYDTTNKLCIIVSYDETYGVLSIILYANESDDNGGDDEVSAAEAIMSEIAYNTFGDETSYYYDDSDGAYWTACYLQGFESNEFVEAVEFYAANCLPASLTIYGEIIEDELQDGGPCGYAEYYNETDTVVVCLLSYFDTEENMMVIQAAAYDL